MPLEKDSCCLLSGKLLNPRAALTPELWRGTVTSLMEWGGAELPLPTPQSPSFLSPACLGRGWAAGLSQAGSTLEAIIM